jgi:hypothetical protein
VRVWKVLGLAGLAGVAATGAVLARDERQRRAYSPDDVRARLQQRHAELGNRAEEVRPAEPPSPRELAGGRRHRLARLLSRRR